MHEVFILKNLAIIVLVKFRFYLKHTTLNMTNLKIVILLRQGFY